MRAVLLRIKTQMVKVMTASHRQAHLREQAGKKAMSMAAYMSLLVLCATRGEGALDGHMHPALHGRLSVSAGLLGQGEN